MCSGSRKPPKQKTSSHLRVVLVIVVDPNHGLQPGLAEFWCGRIRAGQLVLEVHELLRIVLVFTHSRRRHEHGPDAFHEVLDARGEAGHLKHAAMLQLCSKCFDTGVIMAFRGARVLRSCLNL